MWAAAPAHAIGAATHWSQLEAIVFDMAPACEVAREYIARRGFQQHVRTEVGDFWQDLLPAADVHFYSMIYHNRAPEKCRFLSDKSFGSLPSGGRLIAHEMVHNDNKTAPFAVAASSINMLLWTEGEEYRRATCRRCSPRRASATSGCRDLRAAGASSPPRLLRPHRTARAVQRPSGGRSIVTGRKA